MAQEITVTSTTVCVMLASQQSPPVDEITCVAMGWSAYLDFAGDQSRGVQKEQGVRRTANAIRDYVV